MAEAQSVRQVCLTCSNNHGTSGLMPCPRFLDALFHAVDGNFVSNQKDKKMDGDDFPLTLGAGYFANENDVQKFIADLGPFKVEVRIYVYEHVATNTTSQ